MCWLSPLEPDNIHHGVRTTRFEGVENWLWTQASFGSVVDHRRSPDHHGFYPTA